MEHLGLPCSSGAPSLAPPSLAAAGSEGVDAAALAFLLAQSLRLQEVEAEERMDEEERQQREAEEEEELVDRHAEQLALVWLGSLRSPAQEARLLVVTRRRAVLTLSAKARRKKRKKRRKRRRRPRSWFCVGVAWGVPVLVLLLA